MTIYNEVQSKFNLLFPMGSTPSSLSQLEDEKRLEVSDLWFQAYTKLDYGEPKEKRLLDEVGNLNTILNNMSMLSASFNPVFNALEVDLTKADLPNVTVAQALVSQSQICYRELYDKHLEIFFHVNGEVFNTVKPPEEVEI